MTDPRMLVLLLATLTACDEPPVLYVGQTWCASGTTVTVVSYNGWLWRVRVSGEAEPQPYARTYAPDCDEDPTCSWGACAEVEP